jgi:hypothetical protein
MHKMFQVFYCCGIELILHTDMVIGPIIYCRGVAFIRPSISLQLTANCNVSPFTYFLGYRTFGPITYWRGVASVVVVVGGGSGGGVNIFIFKVYGSTLLKS